MVVDEYDLEKVSATDFDRLAFSIGYVEVELKPYKIGTGATGVNFTLVDFTVVGKAIENDCLKISDTRLSPIKKKLVNFLEAKKKQRLE